MREYVLALASLTLLCLGGLLEVGGLGFWGLDALVTLFFAGAVGTGLVSRRGFGQAGAVLGLAALVLHVALLLIA